MAFPQIGTPLGSLLITLLLWFWTFKRARINLFQQEMVLRQQNLAASWAFALCMLLQVMSIYAYHILIDIAVGLACSVVFMTFIISSHRNGEGLWSKRRNQILLGSLVAIGLSSLALTLQDLYFVPILTALLIANICQRRFVKLFTSSMRDLEALQAKLSRQEASLHNSRQIDLQDESVVAYPRHEKQVESRA